MIPRGVSPGQRSDHEHTHHSPDSAASIAALTFAISLSASARASTGTRSGCAASASARRSARSWFALLSPAISAATSLKSEIRKSVARRAGAPGRPGFRHSGWPRRRRRGFPAPVPPARAAPRPRPGGRNRKARLLPAGPGSRRIPCRGAKRRNACGTTCDYARRLGAEKQLAGECVLNCQLKHKEEILDWSLLAQLGHP